VGVGTAVTLPTRGARDEVLGAIVALLHMMQRLVGAEGAQALAACDGVRYNSRTRTRYLQPFQKPPQRAPI
jgi:hypothetical protein